MCAYLPTGNEQISLPGLNDRGGIESLTFLTMAHRGMLELVENLALGMRERARARLLQSQESGDMPAVLLARRVVPILFRRARAYETDDVLGRQNAGSRVRDQGASGAQDAASSP